jgi:hypothetical protein
VTTRPELPPDLAEEMRRLPRPSYRRGLAIPGGDRAREGRIRRLAALGLLTEATHPNPALLAFDYTPLGMAAWERLALAGGGHAPRPSAPGAATTAGEGRQDAG